MARSSANPFRRNRIEMLEDNGAKRGKQFVHVVNVVRQATTRDHVNIVSTYICHQISIIIIMCFVKPSLFTSARLRLPRKCRVCVFWLLL